MGRHNNIYNKEISIEKDNGLKDYEVDAGGATVAMYAGGAMTMPKFYLTGVGQLRTSDGKRYYDLKDQLGNNRATVDETGVVASWSDYYAYGAVRESGSNGASYDTRYKFLGKETNAETDDIDLEARQYDAWRGQFSGVDALSAVVPGLSVYHYSFNNPVRYKDPSGLLGFDPDKRVYGYEDDEGGEHFYRGEDDDPKKKKQGFIQPMPLIQTPPASPPGTPPTSVGPTVGPMMVVGQALIGAMIMIMITPSTPGVDDVPLSTFHRRESKTQTPANAAKQEASGELHGKASQDSPMHSSLFAKVKAHDGKLPEGMRGIEFITNVVPDKGGAPGWPTWSGQRPGVINWTDESGEDWAKIKIIVTKNTQK